MVKKALGKENPLAWIWKKINDFFSFDEEKKIKKLKRKLKECEASRKTLKVLYDKVVNVLRKELEELRTKLQETGEYIEMKKPPWLVEGSYYGPRREVLRKDGKIEWISIPVDDLYYPTPSVRKIARRWKNLARDKKLMKIWDFVIKKIKYAYDYIENWAFAVETLQRGRGDCEDGTILFLTLCRASGIGDVFNVCGMVNNKYGHSYPIAKMSDRRWYIFETTLDWTPRKPVDFFKQSVYDARWGMHNWKFGGRLKRTGVKMEKIKPKSTGENEEKMKEIKKFWKNESKHS